MLPSPLSASPTLFVLVGVAPLALLLVSLLLVWLRVLSRHERARTAVLLVLGALVLFPSLKHAASMRTMPDSLEYAVGAYRMFRDGIYAITLNGVDLPPRYPIGFSLFVALPGLLVAPNSPLGAGVIGVFILTTLGVPCAYVLGRRLYSEAGGIIAAAGYLLIPSLWTASQEVLSNAAAAGASLVAAFLLYLLSATALQFWARAAVAAAAGCAILLLVACRPLSVVLLLPVVVWCFKRKASYAEMLGILLPPVALCLTTAFYNHLVFGEPLRSGYHIYSAIPYDYVSLTFGMQYFTANISELWGSGLIVCMFLTFAASWIIPLDAPARMLRATSLFFAACTAVFHAFYFYPWTFFFLPAVALLVPFVASVVARTLRVVMLRRADTAAWIFFLFVSIALRIAIVTVSHSYNPRAEYLEKVTAALPHGAVLITGLPEPFIDLYGVGRPDLLVVPISRRVEYANKVLMPHRASALDTSGLTAFDTRASIMLQHDAREIYPEVGVESCNSLVQMVKQGAAVFLDTRFSTQIEEQACDALLSRHPIVDGLQRLMTR